MKGLELARVEAAEALELELVTLRASSLLASTNADAMLRAVLVEAPDALALVLCASSLLRPTTTSNIGEKAP
jgi:hypothetical protein